MTSPEAAPRTAAGRALLLWLRENGLRQPDSIIVPYILAIEAEAAAGTALDVERLARAMEEAWPHAIAPSNSHRRWAWTKPSHGLAELIVAAYLAAASEPAGGEP